MDKNAVCYSVSFMFSLTFSEANDMIDRYTTFTTTSVYSNKSGSGTADAVPLPLKLNIPAKAPFCPVCTIWGSSVSAGGVFICGEEPQNREKITAFQYVPVPTSSGGTH